MGIQTTPHNVATVTIPAKTSGFITMMSFGNWDQSVHVKIDNGSEQRYTAGGKSRNKCLGAINVPAKSTPQIVEFSFFQKEQNKTWAPSNLVTRLPSSEGNLETCFLAARDDGSKGKSAFPNCSAFVYFNKDYGPI